MPDSVVSAAWLDASVDELAQRIVRRALLDIGIVEMPPGSNRSPRIDTYVTTAGSNRVRSRRVLGYIAPRPA